MVKPGVSLSTIIKLMPLTPACGLVLQATTTKLALTPLVINILEPFNRLGYNTYDDLENISKKCNNLYSERKRK